MILTKRNDLLYDAKNFDKYYNMYAVLINHRVKTKLEYDLSNSGHDVTVEYIEILDQLNWIFIFEQLINSSKVFNVIYGHFYNNDNTFLYKNTKEDKVVSYTIKRCSKEYLLFNDNKRLVSSKKYEDITTQLSLIDKSYKQEWTENYDRPLDAIYDRSDEILNIEFKPEMEISSRYNDECLTLISSHITIK